RTARRLDPGTVLGAAPPLAMVAVVVAGLGWGGALLRWLGAGPDAASAAGRLGPWLVPYGVIGAAGAAFVIFGRRLPARLRWRLLCGLFATDLAVFTVLAVVLVPAPRGARPAARTPAARPVAALGYPGRFAIYDPGQLYAGQLRQLGAPDLNAVSGAPSVQGYSSLADGRYAAATGAHQAMGDGQDVLSPRAVADGTLDQLGASVLLTVPGYLDTPAAGRGPVPGPPGTGRRSISAGHQTRWYLAAQPSVARVAVPDPAARLDAAAGARIGLLMPEGAPRWFPAAASGSALVIRPAHPMAAIAVLGEAGRRPCQLGPPSVTEPDGTTLVADGQLQDALTPPRWGYAGHDGPFAIFANRRARGPLSLRALPGRSAAGSSVAYLAGPAASPVAAAVRSAHGVRVVRAVAALPGWTATWHPRHGRPATLPVSRDGLVQAVAVPPGAGILTWRYIPPGGMAGLMVSLAAAALVLLLSAGQVTGAWRRHPAA
ncbi:MAG: hypothetical protein J2P34_03600, partial [Actinobacteria bacterium]|nr:hypothetical protein [Actinomycetota bacterium]